MGKIPSAPSVRLRNLTLLLGSTLFAFFLAEAFLRLFVPIRNVGPVLTTYCPHYGTRLKQGFHAKRTTPEFTFAFTTNSLGFRGPEPNGFPARGVLFLGDSFTMGYGVNDGKEFPELIRRALNNGASETWVPVVNAGMGYNGNGRWLKFLEREGRRFEPRLVVLQMMANDFDENVVENLYELDKTTNVLRENPVPAPDWIRRSQVVFEWIPGLSYSYVVSLLLQFIREHRDVLVRPVPSAEAAPFVPPQGSYEDRLTTAILDQVLLQCQRNGWPAIAFIVGVEGVRRQHLLELFQRHDIEVITAPTMDDRPDLHYFVDGHWNPEGHELAAELLLPILQEKLARSLPRP